MKTILELFPLPLEVERSQGLTTILDSMGHIFCLDVAGRNDGADDAQCAEAIVKLINAARDAEQRKR